MEYLALRVKARARARAAHAAWAGAAAPAFGAHGAGRRMASGKGQLSTLDLVVAVMLFAGITLMIVWAWGETQRFVWDSNALDEYRGNAMDLADILLHTPGSPANWETLGNVTPARVRSIGLVSEMSVLDKAKLDALEKSPYANTRAVLGLGKEGYSIRVLDHNGHIKYSIGPERDAAAAVERLAILDGQPVVFRLSLFKEQQAPTQVQPLNVTPIIP